MKDIPETMANAALIACEVGKIISEKKRPVNEVCLALESLLCSCFIHMNLSEQEARDSLESFLKAYISLHEEENKTKTSDTEHE